MTKTEARLPSLCHAAALRRASRHVTRLYDSVLASSGLTISQRSVLAQISRLSHPTVTELAASCGLDRTAMGRAITPLMRDGYVTLLADTNDARRRRVALTTQGVAMLKQSDAGWQQAQTAFEQQLGVKRTRALRELLDALCASEFGNDEDE